MSAPRNIPPEPVPARHTSAAFRAVLRAFAPALALSVAGLTVACADSPTGPAGPGALAAELSYKDAPYDADGDGKLSKEEKEAKKAAEKLTKAELDSLKKDWKAYKDSVKHGEIKAEALRCEPRAAEYAAKRIGPKGGELKIGDHELVVPAGALDEEVEISASAPTGPRAELQFQPHGLTFKQPVEMRISYKGCILPEGDDPALSILYVGNGWRVLERLPTHDKKAAEAVTALTDHFSGYLVGWGRSRSAY
jgi:hypothetical protein